MEFLMINWLYVMSDPIDRNDTELFSSNAASIWYFSGGLDPLKVL